MSRVYIYGLTNPETGQIRYVGQTKDIKRRLRNHLNDAKRGVRSYKNSWVRKLVSSEAKPEIIVIEECDNGIADEREQYWIAYYRENGELTNQTDGGYGARGYVRTEEEKRIISERMKGNKHGLGNEHTEEYKKASSERQKGRTFSEETIEKMRVAARNRPKRVMSEEQKLAISKAHKGKSISKEVRRKISESLKGNKNAAKK